jgi:hypothetical protein
MLVYIKDFLDDKYYLDILFENKKIFKHLETKDGSIKKQIEALFMADDFENLFAPLMSNNEFPGGFYFSIQANYISLTQASGAFIDDIGHYLFRTKNYIYNLLEFHGLTRQENYELDWFKDKIETHDAYDTRKNYGYLLDFIEVNNENTNNLEWINSSEYGDYPEEFLHSIGDGETWEYYLDRDGYEQYVKETKQDDGDGDDA